MLRGGRRNRQPIRRPMRRMMRCADRFTGMAFNAKTGSLLLDYAPRGHSRADFPDAALPVELLLAQWA